MRDWSSDVCSSDLYLFYALSLIRTMVYFVLYVIFFQIFICNVCQRLSPMFRFVLFVPIHCIDFSCFVVAIFKFYFPLKNFDLHVIPATEIIEHWQDTCPEAVQNTKKIADP